jgi:hypothetical protein
MTARVCNAREAIQFLGPARWNGLNVDDYDRLDLLTTARFMMTDMIVDNLIQKVETSAIDPEHVESLCSNGGFIRTQIERDNLFEFVNNVTH